MRPADSVSKHIPILLRPIVEALFVPLLSPEARSDAQGGVTWLVDCTFGGGGHSRAILERMKDLPRSKKVRLLGVDRDLGAIQRAKSNFATELQDGLLELRHAQMSEVGPWVRENFVLGVVADFGFSSDQIEDAQRGLSFSKDGPLDMRLDSSRGATCQELLEQASEAELQEWLRDFGEERYYKRIASAIVERRRRGETPKTTADLVSVVVRALPPHARHGRIHCATRTFQALRMAVNGEVAEVQGFLNEVCRGVRPGGRIAVLSFHSLEDRLVKQSFKNDAEFLPLFKKPQVAPPEELSLNPRARSAKLRIAERV